MSDISSFINDLSKEISTDEYKNPYLDLGAQSNLHTYLSYTKDSKSQILLVGEAPGYRGCLLTGIPFTSPSIIAESRAPFFRHCRNDLVIDSAKSEASARAVWEVLERLNSHVLLWNAFPFHPHKPRALLSNRHPKKYELELGVSFLSKLLSIFCPSIIIAVGRSSEKVLDRELPGTSFKYIRHPSFGGKTQFQSDFSSILLKA